MQLSSASTDVLAALPTTLGRVGLCVLDEAGHAVASFGDAGDAGRESMRIPLPGGGAVVASFATADAPQLALLEALLQNLAQREKLEQDMESMTSSSAQLLEQVFILGETLPRLSAPDTDEEIATVGVKAALGATGVERGIFVRFLRETGSCEVVAHAELDPADGQAHTQPYPGGDTRLLPDGVVGAVLAGGESTVLLSVPEGGRLGLPGSPESLARRELLGVPVSYGAGDKRVTIGALLLMDSAASGWNTRANLGSQECQVALSCAAMIGAVLGARKTAALAKEVSMAQAIQAQILPQAAAQVRGFELAGDYRTCGEVGGDYFDFVDLQDGRTMVVVADVSGHNLASGMVMVSARAMLRTLAGKLGDPARVFDELAAAMYQDLTRFERFITAAAVTLRPGDPCVEVVNAGHNDLMLYRRAARRVEALPSQDTILGFLPDPRYGRRLLQLQPGDFLFVYTDGITETIGVDGDMFGEARLAEVLRGLGDTDAAGILAGTLAAVAAFRGGGERGDDITAVVVKATGDSEAAS